MHRERKQPVVKVGVRTLKNSTVIEYYCTTGGPSVKTCMDQVTRIAAEALLQKLA